MFTLKKYKSFCRSSRTGKSSILNYKKNGIYRLAKISYTIKISFIIFYNIKIMFFNNVFDLIFP